MTHTGIGSATATTVTRCQDTSSSPCKLSMDGDMTPAVNRGLLTRDTLFKGLTLAATPQSILDPDALASPACPASTSGHSSVTSRSELARNRQSPIGRSSFVFRPTSASIEDGPATPKLDITGSPNIFNGCLDGPTPCEASPCIKGSRAKQRTTGRLSSSQPEPIVIASPMWSAKIRVHDVASSLQRVSLDLSPAGKSENAMTALEDAMASTSPRFSVNDCDLEVSPPRTNLISPFFKIQQQDQKHQRFEKRNAEVDEDEPFLLSRRRSSVASLPPFSPPGMHSMFMFNDMDGLQSDGRVCTKLDIPQQDSGDISMIIEAEAMHASQAPVYSSVDVPPRPPWSTDWSHPGKSFRMFNRAQSHHGYDYEAPPEECMQDWQGSENSSIPHTPHSPDPELLISNAPWGGDCPPTPAQQRIRCGRVRKVISPDSASEIDAIARNTSLNDDKILLQTLQLARCESYTRQDTFKFQDHFEFIKFIGFSKFSEVSAVRHKIRKNEEYAIKKTRRQFRSHKDRERCMQEIRAVMALDPHPNIVGQYRAWQQAGHFYIQMDLCTGGSLSSMLDNARNTDEHLDDSELWRILLDVSQGLAFLHKSGVTHLDIKPENIYKDAEGAFRVGDFGQAVLRDEWMAEEGDGDYVAPEFFKPDARAKEPADLFSLGVTMYECATLSKLPRSGDARHAQNVKLHGRPIKLQYIIREMLAEDPEQRPTSEYVVQFCHDHGTPSDRKPVLNNSILRKRRSTTDSGAVNGNGSPPIRSSSTRRLVSPSRHEADSPEQSCPSFFHPQPSESPDFDRVFRRNWPAHIFGIDSSAGSMDDMSTATDSTEGVPLELSY